MQITPEAASLLLTEPHWFSVVHGIELHEHAGFVASLVSNALGAIHTAVPPAGLYLCHRRARALGIGALSPDPEAPGITNIGCQVLGPSTDALLHQLVVDAFVSHAKRTLHVRRVRVRIGIDRAGAARTHSLDHSIELAAPEYASAMAPHTHRFSVA